MDHNKPRRSWVVDASRIELDATIRQIVDNLVAQGQKRFEAIRQTADTSASPYLFAVRGMEQRILELLPPEMKPTVSVPGAGRRLYGDNKIAHDFVFEAIRDNAIVRASPTTRLISPQGGKNDWLIDMRRIFMDGVLLDAVAELFWQHCAELLPFQVGGMEVAAVPLVAAILMKGVERGTPVNGFIVRKERKTYGEGKLYEGTLTDAPIVIVDDLINSGSSLDKIRAVLANEDKHIADVFVLIDYASRRGMEWREQHKINIRAPYRLADFGLHTNQHETAPPAALFQNVWDFKSPDPNFFHRVPKSFPVTDGKHVFFGSDGGNFWCLDAATGKKLWSYGVASFGHKNIWSAPALHQGRVYFGSYDGNVYCLDAATGKPVWTFEEADWVGSSPALAPELGLLFIGLEFAVEGKRGGVVALNMETGERVWEFENKRYTHASPAYWPERQLVACGSNDNEMFLFDAKTGRMLWRFETDSTVDKGSIRHAPAFDAKREQLITGCANGTIYIIDINTGLECWSVKTDNTIYTVPLVVGDRAYIGSTDKYFYVLNLEKRIVEKKIFVGAKLMAPARLINGQIYFAGFNGIVYRLDAETLDITGAHQLPDCITNPLCYSAETGLYYALTYVNQLFALRPLNA